MSGKNYRNWRFPKSGLKRASNDCCSLCSQSPIISVSHGTRKGLSVLLFVPPSLTRVCVSDGVRRIL